MALQKLAAPSVAVTYNFVCSWPCLMKVGQAAMFVPKAKVCVNVNPYQQYSRRLEFTEEELCARSKFLATHFHGSETEMQHFLTNNQQLVSMGKEKFFRLTELLAQHGITKRELFIYPNVYRRKYETVAGRIRQLEEGGVKPVTLRMINTTYKKYQSKYGRLILDLEASEMYKSSLDLLSQELGLSEAEAEEIIGDTLWLSNTKLSTLKEKIELLWSFGVSSDAIRERIWVLAFPVSTIRARLETLKCSGLLFKDFPKSYLIAIKSSEEKFLKFKERLVEDKAILDSSDCSDKASYLCSRLSCSREDLEVMRRKFPALLSVRLPKLKSNLDLLSEFGVDFAQIVESPRVLRLSIETLGERLKQLQCHGIPVTVKLLNLSNQDYVRFISKLTTPI